MVFFKLSEQWALVQMKTKKQENLESMCQSKVCEIPLLYIIYLFQQNFLLLMLSFFLSGIQSVTFKTTSRNLARAMCMKNLKLTLVIVLVCLVSSNDKL